MLGADPPISGEELALVAEVGAQVEHLLFVMNKADRLPPDENAEATSFAERIVRDRLGRPLGIFFSVSATEQLAGTGQPRGWDALVRALERLARDGGSTLLEVAEARGANRLLARLASDLAAQSGALERPIAESEQCIAALRRAVDDAGRALGDLGALFAAESQRMERAFAERRDELLTRPLPSLPITRDRAAALAEARRVARQVIDAWRQETQPNSEELYRKTAARFVELANELLARLAAVPGLESLPRDVPPEAGFRTRATFYFNDLLSVAEPGIGRAALDKLAPRRGGIGRDARRYLGRLVETNSARVVNDLRDRLLESRRRLETEIRARLGELVTAAERALERARAIQAAGAETTAAARAYLDSLEVRVRDLAAQ